MVAWIIAVTLSWLVVGGMPLGSACAAIRAEPHAVTHVNGVQKYGYGVNGNMTNRDGAILTWDAENRLSSVNQAGRVTTFTYDADGRRVKKETPWGTTYYVGDHYERYVPASGLSTLPGDANADCRVSAVDVQLTAVKWGLKWGDAGYGLVYDVDQDGAVTAGDLQTSAANWRATVASPCTNIPVVVKYYRLGGRLVALWQNGVLRYVHTDHLGSVSLLTDGSGKVVSGSVQRFFPFGKTRTGQPVLLPTDRNFTGQSLDANTGLLYYGNAGYGRYYDPALGRFVQPDPVVSDFADPQALNRYSYVRNNPLRYTDPSGHWWETALDVIFTAWDIGDLLAEPSWEKAGAVGLDLVFIAAPLPNVVAGVKRVGPAAETLQKLNRLRELASHVRGVETLGKALSHPSWWKRAGATFELERALHYAEKGLLEGIEVSARFDEGRGFVDLMLKGGQAVEVKNWAGWAGKSQEAKGELIGRLKEQVSKYLSGSPDLKVEKLKLEFKLEGGVIPDDLLQELNALKRDFGDRLEWEVFR